MNNLDILGWELNNFFARIEAHSINDKKGTEAVATHKQVRWTSYECNAIRFSSLLVTKIEGKLKETTYGTKDTFSIINER